jgi:NAD(P)-dependent dehydrogenase (short-subunit alcohol dehydrogenase family)
MTKSDATGRDVGDSSAGRTVLVTGANRGLGQETARELARRGFRVIATSRGPERTPDRPGAIEHRPLDVACPRSIAALARELAGERRAIDVLINNAAIALDGFDAEVARRTVAVNFTGALGVTEALLDSIPRGGTVVMVSSGVGELFGLRPEVRARFADPGLTRDSLIALVDSFVADVAAGHHRDRGWPSSAYQVSKAGLNALVRVLAPDLAARGIRVVAVCPGWVRTDMGGVHATRSLAEGAASIVWAATLTDGTTGGFFRDGVLIPW